MVACSVAGEEKRLLASYPASRCLLHAGVDGAILQPAKANAADGVKIGEEMKKA